MLHLMLHFFWLPPLLGIINLAINMITVRTVFDTINVNSPKISLGVVKNLDPQKFEDQPLGLHGEHQYMNAGLAVALSNTWLERQGHLDRIQAKRSGTLPDQFIEGLSSACLQGRAQIVPDPQVHSENDKDSNSQLVFYLDGAHSPESMEMCARWFVHVTNNDGNQSDSLGQPHSGRNFRKILLFNCMSVRDPQRLLPLLLDTCAQKGLHFEKALFVPNQSQYNKLGSLASPPSKREQIDLSWQLSLQRLWESLPHSNQGLIGENSSRASSIFESLPLAIKWLRETAQQNQSTQFQVLVTGSLHLVGDVLRLLKK